MPLDHLLIALPLRRYADRQSILVRGSPDRLASVARHDVDARHGPRNLPDKVPGFRLVEDRQVRGLEYPVPLLEPQSDSDLVELIDLEPVRRRLHRRREHAALIRDVDTRRRVPLALEKRVTAREERHLSQIG